MKKNASLAMVVAFVICLGGGAKAGVFGNDNLELTPDQELVVRMALGEQVVVRVKVADNIPLPQAQIMPPAPAPVATSVAAPVAQAPVNYQPPIVDPFGPAVQRVPSFLPPAQAARPPANPPAVQPKKLPEARAASVPAPRPAAPVAARVPAKPANPVAAAPAKPAAPVAATPAPAKPAVPAAVASAKPSAPAADRKFRAMRMPFEGLPEQFNLPNGKLFKKVKGELYEVTNGNWRLIGNTPWLVSEYVNGIENTAGITFLNAPPAGAEIESLKG
ncbi:MAG: hypothetical protein PHP25_02875 [Candidatus Moranbacteria bacterium]|nr:hypothetical protein [Candidatus Moranbacteria bacterium]